MERKEYLKSLTKKQKEIYRVLNTRKFKSPTEIAFQLNYNHGSSQVMPTIHKFFDDGIIERQHPGKYRVIK